MRRAVFALLLFGAAGCVHRSLTVVTEPLGAIVYDNDVLKGESPVTFDFLWYGWHRLILRKEGYERVQETKMIRSPVYLWIPFDLAWELLPLPVRDRRTWSYTLNPLPMMPTPVPPPAKKTEPSPISQETPDGQTR